MIDCFTPTQTNVLLALARHKFLTSSQLLRLKVTKQRSHLSNQIGKLRDRKRPYISQIEFGFQPRKGRLESFYFLKKRAGLALMETLKLTSEQIKIPVGTSTLFTQDYFHRKFTIDCEIAAYTAAKKEGIEVLFSDRYFDKIGSNRSKGNLRAKTKVDIQSGHYLIADGIFLLQPKPQKELYCLEMYNDRDTKRVLKQLRQYLQALTLGSPSIKYNFKRGNRVLCVFEIPTIMKSVLGHLAKDKDYQNMNPYFLFKSLEDIEANFFDKWININGEIVRMF